MMKEPLLCKIQLCEILWKNIIPVLSEKKKIDSRLKTEFNQIFILLIFFIIWKFNWLSYSNKQLD